MEIIIHINDEHFDIGTFVSQFASVSNVTINIFTREDDIAKSDILQIVDTDAVILTDEPQLSEELTPEQLMAALDDLEGDEQTALASKLHFEEGITWTTLGKHLEIRSDTLWRRSKTLKEKSKRKKKAKKAKKARPKVAPKPKEPPKASVPTLSEYEIMEAVYGVIQGNPGGVHFANTISTAMITSYTTRYAADSKLDEFKTAIGSRIDLAMNKIALGLGQTKCMVTRSQQPDGQFTIQIMVYSKNIPELDILWDKLSKIGALN